MTRTEILKELKRGLPLSSSLVQAIIIQLETDRLIEAVLKYYVERKRC